MFRYFGKSMTDFTTGPRLYKPYTTPCRLTTSSSSRIAATDLPSGPEVPCFENSSRARRLMYSRML